MRTHKEHVNVLNNTPKPSNSTPDVSHILTKDRIKLFYIFTSDKASSPESSQKSKCTHYLYHIKQGLYIYKGRQP